MVDVANENVAWYLLLLEMAFQTQRRVPLIQQALVHGTVRRVTDGTTLPQCLMLIHKRAALLCVTLKAGFVSAEESKTAGSKLLLNVCRSPFDRHAFMHFVTIGTAHFAFRNRVMVR